MYETKKTHSGTHENNISYSKIILYREDGPCDNRFIKIIYFELVF
jgi:hypothetical protein